MQSFIQDLRYGLRMLAKNPGFTAVAVLTLALGIGANTTIFSVISEILLRKPSVKDPDSLMMVSSKNTIRGWDLQQVSAPDFESWRLENRAFEDIAAAATDLPFALSTAGEAESVLGDRVATNYFSVVGRAPALGRAFLPSDGQAGHDHVVILSHNLWLERFSRDKDVIGKQLKLDGELYIV